MPGTFSFLSLRVVPTVCGNLILFASLLPWAASLELVSNRLLQLFDAPLASVSSVFTEASSSTRRKAQ